MKFIDKKESYRLAQNFKYPNGYWHYRFDRKTWHLNLQAKTRIGLVFKKIKAYIRSCQK